MTCPDVLLLFFKHFLRLGNMNTTEPGANFSSSTEYIIPSNLTTTNVSSTNPQPPSYSSDIHDPEFTIMVVLGLSLLLAALAAFLAVCRPSEKDEDSEDSGCGPGESLTRRRRRTSEPQLKVWRRLGSYRRSYNLSFRRPQPRRSHERDSKRATQTPIGQTAPTEHLTMPCLLDYVTEIWRMRTGWWLTDWSRKCDYWFIFVLLQRSRVISGLNEGDIYIRRKIILHLL